MARGDDRRLDALLARGRMGRPERERVLHEVLRAVGTDRVAWWRRGHLAWWAPAVAAAAALLLLFPPIERPAGDYREKGGAATASGVEVGCREGRCMRGATLMFRVDGVRERAFFSAWAEPVGGGERIWYFPDARGASPEVAAAAGSSIVREGVRLGPEHRAGAYDVHWSLSRQPLSREQALAGSPQIVQQAVTRIEVSP